MQSVFMNWKRYFRLRHFLKTVRFLVADQFLPEYKRRDKSLVLVKTEAIGDYLLFRNFLEQVKKSQKYHDYRIILVGNEAWKSLAEAWDSTWVDDFIWINRKRFVDDADYRKSKLAEVRLEGASVVAQANYSREVIWGDSLVRASGSEQAWGSIGDAANDLPVFKNIADSWYSHLTAEPGIPLFEFDKNTAFFKQFLGIETDLQFPQTPDVWCKPAQMRIGLFPGAGEKIKQWPIANFIELARRLSEVHKEASFLVLGGPDDFKLGEEIRMGLPQVKVENLCGKTSLPELSKLIAELSILITNDSSAYHFAAASGTSQVCLLMGRHFGRFSPYPISRGKIVEVYPERFRAYMQDPAQCARLTQYGSPCTIEEIGLDTVLNAALSLLEDEISTAR